MPTSFIKVHVSGEQVLINLLTIKYVSGNFVCVDDEAQGFSCDESFEDINNMIAEELEACK